MKNSNQPILFALLALTLAAAACSRPVRQAGSQPTTPLVTNMTSLKTPTSISLGAVSTTSGPVRGVQNGDTMTYLGIPFAAPPIGDLRWQPPATPQPWTEELLSDSFAPPCPQMDEDGQIIGSEDCLYLNIWTPLDATPASNLPVMVYIHGGGNVQGSAVKEFSGVRMYDGQQLATRDQVVVITLQYRLGALGFLVHPALSAENEQGASGNYGLLDQIAALHWVQDNITNFGGDPTRVLLFGESGGAVDTCMLLVSPLANGLFSRALMESGACVAESAQKRALEGQAFVSAAGCNTATDPLACLRRLDITQIVSAVDTTPIQGGVVTMAFGANVDGYVLPQAPLAALESGRFNRVPIMIGSNADEMLPQTPAYMTQKLYEAAVHKSLDVIQPGLAEQVLALYPIGDDPGEYENPRHAFAALVSDAQFTCSARAIARSVVQSGTPVYRYFFTKTLDAPLQRRLGSFHGLELFYVFQHMEEMDNYTASNVDLSLQSDMLGYWTRFAATGNPNGGSAVEWSSYNPATDNYLELGLAVQPGSGLHSAQCDFWEHVSQIRRGEFSE